MVRFRATLEPVSHGGCFVVVPPDAAAKAGLAYKDRVRGSVRGVPYQSSLMKYSGVFHLGVPKATLGAVGAGVGDRIEIEVERDPTPLAIPDDLARALAARPGVRAAFDALAPAHRRGHVKAVTEAKREETRARRIARVVAALDPSRRR